MKKLNFILVFLKVAQYAGLHYYTDKELQVTSEAACRLACEIENEFLCRSFLYKGTPQGSQYNCQLFHLDHKTLPDGPSTYLNADRPLIDNGERIGSYFENTCESKLHYVAIFYSNVLLLMLALNFLLLVNLLEMME